MVQRDMRGHGLPVLSIHDGFVSWKRAKAELQTAMQAAFASVVD